MRSSRTLSLLSTLCVATVLAAACGKSSGGTPTSQSETTENTVTEEGGTLTSSSGTTLQFPAGAVASASETEDIVTLVVPEADVAALPSGTMRISEIYEFSPHGKTFAKPITVSFPLTSTTDDVTVLRLDNSTDTTWEVVEGATAASGTVSFLTARFSYYVAVAGHDSGTSDGTGGQGTSTPEGTGGCTMGDGDGGYIDGMYVSYEPENPCPDPVCMHSCGPDSHGLSCLGCSGSCGVAGTGPDNFFCLCDYESGLWDCNADPGAGGSSGGGDIGASDDGSSDTGF